MGARREAGDSCYFRPHVPGISKLLLVHQTQHQRYIMALYGQTIVGMDATYKTNQHGYPFFLVSVVTNHGQSYPVAMAVVEDEAGETVAEALQQLRLLKPSWQPQYIMMDKSDAELNAVSDVFPDDTPLLCDFHRLQAWWRWITRPTMRCQQAGSKLSLRGWSSWPRPPPGLTLTSSGSASRPVTSTKATPSCSVTWRLSG